ncbi:MAG TPA: NADH-quinone oxidoreductase subunit NuoK [Dehalococcoidia bacterium]|nr:NADH-quinone oxidoreductase subunit NuoK [Dehalococcoidia bacterium]
MSVGLEHFLILSAVLFSIGLYGVLAKRNAVIILMSIEIMLAAVSISMAAFSRYSHVITGQVFVIFIMVVAAAEVTVGLALIITIYRRKKTVDAEKFDLMKW